jgi:hypothetical protein
MKSYDVHREMAIDASMMRITRSVCGRPIEATTVQRVLNHQPSRILIMKMTVFWDVAHVVW